MDVINPIKVVDVQTFTGNGTWTKPTGAVSVSVSIIGGGGGGDAGIRDAAGKYRYGGLPGAGAGWTVLTFDAATLSATVAVTIGTGGTGAPAVTVNSTAGAGSTAGTDTTFGAYLVASGAPAGTPATITTPNAAGAFANPGKGATIGGGGVFPSYGCPVGGDGGGITDADIYDTYTPIAGFSPGIIPVTAPAAGVNGTSAGGNGTNSTVSGPGSSGAGGGANTGGAGFAGGNGGLYGSGGGGGGGSTNGTNSGKGGDGGGGCAVVTSYF